MLTGKYRKGETGRAEGFGGKVFQSENTAQRTNILDTVLKISNEIGVSANQVAIGLGKYTWYCTNNWAQNLNTINIELSIDQIKLLDSVSSLMNLDQHRKILRTGSHMLDPCIA